MTLDIVRIHQTLENANAEQLRSALRYALAIIENYQVDIRHSERTGVNLVEKGFCQGVIYRDAYADILRRLEEMA